MKGHCEKLLGVLLILLMMIGVNACSKKAVPSQPVSVRWCGRVGRRNGRRWRSGRPG